MRAPSRPNLSKFTMRQMIENDNMRARIYDELRKVYELTEVTPLEMRKHISACAVTRKHRDLALLDFCKHLEAARVALLKADLALR